MSSPRRFDWRKQRALAIFLGVLAVADLVMAIAGWGWGAPPSQLYIGAMLFAIAAAACGLIARSNYKSSQRP